MDLLKKITKWE
ncbi:hypothetical protein Patl1_10563 [Pistacia atlantica]|uniref:Uncharacterized protein n=1 Tax=Pistacia atlantica TaxID=434234 RepID=A0ACC1A585_9ROSI|nr:hypothetical protein Patl1_10563 [Pistacia atlantica]